MSELVGRLISTGFGIYLCAVGVLFAAIAIGLFAKRLKISAGPRAQGRIVGYSKRVQQGGARKPHYMPLVRFTPRGHAAVEFQSRMSADPLRWPEGTIVKVAYRADRFGSAEIATGARLWLAPPVLALFALMSFATAWKAGG